MTVYVTCKQTALHVYKNSCKVLIRLSKTNLKLPICSSFFLSCLVAYSSPSSCCHTCSFAALIFCLSLWKPNLLPSYKTHLFVNLNTCFHSSYFAARKISLNRFTGFMYKLYYHDLWLIPSYMYSLKNYLNVINTR